MRVALLSDIHGNEIALRAVLDEIDREGADVIYCLGDVAPLGPRPRETLDLLRSRHIRCVMGNHDEFLLDADLIRQYPTVAAVADAVDWCRAELSTDQLEFVRSFEREIHAGELRLFHGSPRSHMEMILATTPADDLEEMLNGRRGAVLAGGHTHVQMMRQHRGQLVVNAGSVGMPFAEHVAARPGPPKVLAHAEYAMLRARNGSVRVELRRVELDREELYRASLDTTNPMRELLAMQYA